MKSPGPDHPIVIEPFSGTASVSVGNVEIARSGSALALSEASYPVVYYLPRGDVAMDLVQRSGKVTHCPYKGDAAHFTIHADGKTVEDVSWSYEQPYGAVAAIGEFLAFYPENFLLAIVSSFLGALPGMVSVLLLEHIITAKERHLELKKQTALLEKLLIQKENNTLE